MTPGSNIVVTTILLPLDGSIVSERALPYASTLARRSGGRVVLVEAVEIYPFRSINLSEARSEAINQAGTYLRQAATRLSAKHVTAEAHTYYDKPVPSILDAASRHHADLIVMSTHGRSGLGRMLYGSVTDAVLRQAMVPVLVVPSTVDRAWSPDRPLSVLVPLDGSGLSEEALDALSIFSAGGGIHVTLLRVVDPPYYPVYGEPCLPSDEMADVTAATNYLDYQVAKLRARGHESQGKIIVGDPAGVIAAIAREQHVDLVMMSTHGYGGLSRLLLGSTATSVLHQISVPMVLARPAALKQAEATPGDDNGHEPAAQALARRLESSARAGGGEPTAAR